jgi:hypothetical protein
MCSAYIILLQVLISHLADIEAKLASIPVCRSTKCSQLHRPIDVSLNSSMSLTVQQVPLHSLVVHSDDVAAETKLPTASKSSLNGLQQVLADTFEPHSRNAVVDDAQEARTRRSNSGEGPIALALAAARESRHRRAAAVAAATAAASASLASAKSAKHQSTESIAAHANPACHAEAPITAKECNTYQDNSISHEVKALTASSSASKLDEDVHVDRLLPATRSSVEKGGKDCATTAAASTDDRNVSFSKKAVVGSSEDVAAVMMTDGSPSTAAAHDGIILWSRMDKDKRVHLNDFLANR